MFFYQSCDINKCFSKFGYVVIVLSESTNEKIFFFNLVELFKVLDELFKVGDLKSFFELFLPELCLLELKFICSKKFLGIKSISFWNLQIKKSLMNFEPRIVRIWFFFQSLNLWKVKKLVGQICSLTINVYFRVFYLTLNESWSCRLYFEVVFDAFICILLLRSQERTFVSDC